MNISLESYDDSQRAIIATYGKYLHTSINY